MFCFSEQRSEELVQSEREPSASAVPSMSEGSSAISFRQGTRTMTIDEKFARNLHKRKMKYLKEEHEMRMKILQVELDIRLKEKAMIQKRCINKTNDNAFLYDL